MTRLALLAALACVHSALAYSGRATFYSTGLGSCGYYSSDSDMIVALNTDQYGNGCTGTAQCNRALDISYGGVTVQATVADCCPSCSYGGLDMSPGLFKKFADLDAGVFYMSWSWAGSDDDSDKTTKKSTTTTWKPTTTWQETTTSKTTAWSPTTTWSPSTTWTPTTTWTPSTTSKWTTSSSSFSEPSSSEYDSTSSASSEASSSSESASASASASDVSSDDGSNSDGPSTSSSDGNISHLNLIVLQLANVIGKSVEAST